MLFINGQFVGIGGTLVEGASEADEKFFFNNIKEVKTRGATTIIITTDKIDNEFNPADYKIVIPTTNDFINPMVATIPLQLIGYETAKLKGCEIDTPKNLAKSVTVE